jgi:hypothetical protein
VQGQKAAVTAIKAVQGSPAAAVGRQVNFVPRIETGIGRYDNRALCPGYRRPSQDLTGRYEATLDDK